MSLLHKRLTKIQNHQAEVRVEDKKRQKFLNRLKTSILSNESKRELRDEFGKGPYTFDQYLGVYYKLPVLRDMMCDRDYLLQMVSKDHDWDGASLELPKAYKGVENE